MPIGVARRWPAAAGRRSPTGRRPAIKENNNFDGDFTNWCTGPQSLVVTLGCLQFNPL